MKLSFVGSCIGVALLLPVGVAHSQVHQSLKDVVQKVVLTNPEVLASWHAFKAAGDDVDVARAGYFPRVDGTAGVGKETLEQAGVSQNFRRNGYTLTLNQMLFDGFATANDVRRLDKARLTRYFQVLEASEGAALEAAKTYRDVVRYQRLTFLAENNYVDHRVVYEQLLRRAQSGAGRRVDVEHAASRLALAEYNLNTEAANLHDVVARYIRLVGEAPPKVMFAPARLSDSFPASKADAVRTAFRVNPALRAAIANVESAQHELDGRRAPFMPRVDFKIRNESNSNYQGATTDRVNNVAEVVLTYNFFNGGADRARQSASAQQKNVALDLREKACRDIRQTLSIAFNDVPRLKTQLENVALQVSSIEKTRDAYKAQFNIGQRSLLDLLDTENELLTARRTEVISDLELSGAYLRTQAGMGRLLESLGLKHVEAEDAPDPEDIAGIVAEEVCPAETPISGLVDIKALTDRALAQINAAKTQGVPLASAASGSGSPWFSAATPEASQTEGTGSAMPATPQDSKASVMPAAELPAIEKLLHGRVVAWVAAWSARDYATYSGFYAASFSPADGVDRATWAKQREMRLNKAKQIKVDVTGLRVLEMGKDVFAVEFEQDYVSDTYRDKTTKSLQWVKAGEQWLIEREAVRPMRVPGTDSAPATGEGSK
ncbi:MAG: TolC family outer membrane protein [Rhodocyclaceae bacterium]|nr:TolC family outer membrane protein [Rhodocyclaceae bacterium]